MTEVVINPPATVLGRANAVLNGRGRRRYESRFTGPLSVKAVISGRATWETAEGRYELVPGSLLLLNDGEEYTITVDALQPVETFCFFFERGFVEGACSAAAVFFHERLQFDPLLVNEVLRAHRDRSSLAESFYSIALHLARLHADTAERMAKLPPLRAATRTELARRLGIATSYLHANATRAVTIAEAARAACLSPFHFHRAFTQFHGVTPHRYLGRLRLERARALLRAGEDSVIDVAVACGFESLGSFTALYKKTFGVTPGREYLAAGRRPFSRRDGGVPSAGSAGVLAG